MKEDKPVDNRSSKNDFSAVADFLAKSNPINGSNMPRKQTLAGHQQFWCQVCDSNVVDSDNQTTGKFYIVFGHACDEKMDATSIIFAVCSDCKKEDALKECDTRELVLRK